ncbi:hypothetical protein UPYG_G00108500 [Umbra pygmaea]|uniref:RRM domain-containing protein n=1 Tax=Umbra pygmaea TaxID=75934 RepID=A0ABD0XI02_UMBPY
MTVGMESMEAQRRGYISLPKKYMAALSEKWDLDHGIVIKELNPNMNKQYLEAYFKTWGSITSCNIKPIDDSAAKTVTAMGYVRFSTEDEADRADWAGPHCIGGLDVVVKRVVRPKMNKTKSSEGPEVTAASPALILKNAQGLEEVVD